MNRHGYIGRKVNQPKIEEKPAIIIVAFGSTTKAVAVLNLFDATLQKHYPDHRIIWAYTSAVIRKKTGKPSLHQALAQVEAENFRKVVVQPLHVFPGTEYQQLEETCEYFPGLQVRLGETLMHRWDQIEDVLGVVEKKFLPTEKGLNLLVLHGTPSAANPANIVYIGLDHLLRRRYTNVVAAAVEGIPDFHSLVEELKRTKAYKKWDTVQMIPFLYMAGIHAAKDLMGRNGWQSSLHSIGFQTAECLTIKQHTDKGEDEMFMGLGYYPEIVAMYLKRLERALYLTKFY